LPPGERGSYGACRSVAWAGARGFLRLGGGHPHRVTRTRPGRCFAAKLRLRVWM